MAKQRTTPRYIKIAQDICGKILTGEYPEGTLLKGRSILGASYNVSPETVRKALNILKRTKSFLLREVSVFSLIPSYTLRSLPISGRQKPRSRTNTLHSKSFSMSRKNSKRRSMQPSMI